MIRSSAQDAYVYVRGLPVGPVGQKLRVRCGLLHVRLGTNPLATWFGQHKSVLVACQGVTSVLMEPGAAVPWTSEASPREKARSTKSSRKTSHKKGTWVPDDI